MGFSVPPRLRWERWALTPPFHPYRSPCKHEPTAVYFLWHYPSGCLAASLPACILRRIARQVTRHRALRCSDFPPPPSLPRRSDSPPFQNREQYSVQARDETSSRWIARIVKDVSRRAFSPLRLELKLTMTHLIRHSQIHVVAVVENAAAIGASDQFLLSLAGDDDLRRQPHVTTAANSVLHADNDIFAFVSEQPLVTRPRELSSTADGQFLAIGGQFRQFFFRFCSRAPSWASCSSMNFARFGGSLGGAHTSFWAASACSINSISWSSILKISSLHISISWRAPGIPRFSGSEAVGWRILQLAAFWPQLPVRGFSGQTRVA